MIVEDQLDRRVGRIGGVEKLEEFDEFAAAMAILDHRMDLAGDEVDAGEQADRAVTFIFMLTCEGRMHAGLGRKSGRSLRWPGRRALVEEMIAIASLSFFFETAAACFNTFTWR